jgi:acyl dehydratase
MFKLGDKKAIKILVTDEKVRQFAEVSGDFNPIHLDEAFAAKTKFGRRIAHGMLSGAFISRMLTESFGSGIYLSQTLKFMAPVFVGDEIEVSIHVTNVREEKGIGFVETLVKNQNGDLCVKGEAVILRAERVAAST